jgi:hypothetical protein
MSWADQGPPAVLQTGLCETYILCAHARARGCRNGASARVMGPTWAWGSCPPVRPARHPLGPCPSAWRPIPNPLGAGARAPITARVTWGPPRHGGHAPRSRPPGPRSPGSKRSGPLPRQTRCEGMRIEREIQMGAAGGGQSIKASGHWPREQAGHKPATDMTVRRQKRP